MYSNRKKTLIIVTVLIVHVALLVSCTHSCYQVITQADATYWSRYWLPDNPHGSIVEFSKKDSAVKYLDENWVYDVYTPALWGLKFKINNDTLFTYVKRKDTIITYDILPIVSSARSTIIFKNGESEHVKWHRISTKYAKKVINAPNEVKLSSLIKTRDKDKNITDIVGPFWKLYGYGDVSTGIIRKSESLKCSWMNIIKFGNDGVMSGLSTYNKLCGEYTISESNIDFFSFESGERGEDFDGNEFCNVLPQCKKFEIANNWLLLYYDESKKYLLFRISQRTKGSD